jgi:vancomycin resistance protein VanJ
MLQDELQTDRARGSRRLTWLQARLVTLSNVYLTCLFSWAFLRFLFQDRWSWLFLISSVAPYLFLPILLTLLTAIWTRRRSQWLGSLMALALWLLLYGELFLPRSAPVEAADANLTVMTYNILGFNQEADAVVSALRRSEADVIALGELNPEIGAAVSQELNDLYPYQMLNPRPGVTGTGVISRYPLRSGDERLGGQKWTGTPQVLTLDLDGRPILLVHFHAIPLVASGQAGGLMYSVRIREAQAQAIVDLVADQERPVIVLGDLNASDQHKAYQILASRLTDSWREAGWRLGHTFPGAASPGSSRPFVLGIPLPKWMIRIDYIFHNEYWSTASAEIGPWEGVSDHRPVIARLLLDGLAE